jgi:hypothetical protein
MIMMRSPAARVFPAPKRVLAFRPLAATVMVVAPAAASAVSVVYSFTMVPAALMVLLPSMLLCANTAEPMRDNAEKRKCFVERFMRID